MELRELSLRDRIAFHKDLKKLSEEQKQAVKQALESMDETEKELFLTTYPPILRRNGNRFEVVGHYVSFAAIHYAMDPDKAFLAHVYEMRECPDSRVIVRQKMDALVVAGLLSMDQGATRHASRPTNVKYKRLAKDQICPKCETNGKRVPLSGPNNAKALVKTNKGGVLRCLKCAFRIKATPEQLEAFQEYKKSTDEILNMKPSPTDAPMNGQSQTIPLRFRNHEPNAEIGSP